MVLHRRKGWMRFVIPLFRIVIRKRAGAGLAGKCGAERRACAGKGSALKCCWSGGNAKGGGDGVRHECAMASITAWQVPAAGDS